MSNEKSSDFEIDDDSGWFSEPSVEYVIEHDEEKKGIIDKIKYYFMLLF